MRTTQQSGGDASQHGPRDESATVRTGRDQVRVYAFRVIEQRVGGTAPDGDALQRHAGRHDEASGEGVELTVGPSFAGRDAIDREGVLLDVWQHVHQFDDALVTHRVDGALRRAIGDLAEVHGDDGVPCTSNRMFRHCEHRYA